MLGLTGAIEDDSRLSRTRLVCQRPAVTAALGKAPADALTFMLATGDEGTRQTLGAMKAIAQDAARLPRVQATARVIRQIHTPGPRGLWKYLKDAMDFRRDPARIEYLQHPEILLKALDSPGAAWPMQGDCDDRATLGAALALNLGLRPAFVVIGTRRDGPYQHVYFQTTPADRPATPFIIDPQETTIPGAEVPHARRLVCPI